MKIRYELVPTSRCEDKPSPDRAWRWELRGHEVGLSSSAVSRSVEDSGVVPAEGASEVLIWLLAYYDGWGALDTDEPFTIEISPVDDEDAS